MKKEMLEEINRMRVLGGILNEAPNPTQIIPMLIAKFTRTSLDDAILTTFESLEKRGVITIDNATKTLTKVDWIRFTDDELKLLFTAQPLRDALKEVTTAAGVDITSSAQKITFKGNFKRIVKGYDDAAGSVISGGGSSAGGKVTTTAANIAIDLEGYLTKYFPNITSDKNIYSSLVNEIKPKLSNLDTKGQIDFITDKCTSLEKQIGDNLQNLTDMDSKESVAAMKKASSILKVIKEKLKKYGPVSFTRTDKVNWLSTISRTLAWIVATDILVLGAFESRKTGQNLADTMFKRAGDRASFILGLFIGSTPEKSTQPETKKPRPY